MNFSEELKKYYSQELELRKNWYSPVADAYNKGRPHYNPELINRVIELTNLNPSMRILEIGCGPGNATVAFALQGFSLLCLEPSPAFCQLVRQNCALYPNVEIQQTSFEEWELGSQTFDVVLAANSFHWISPEVKYLKSAAALKDNGYLILLWNMTPQPQYETSEILAEVYQNYAPSLMRYEDETFQETVINNFGNQILASGRFQNLLSEIFSCELNYPIDNYLLFLDSCSPYQTLDSEIKKRLFAELNAKIEDNCGGSIKTSYLSAFHIAQKSEMKSE